MSMRRVHIFAGLLCGSLAGWMTSAVLSGEGLTEGDYKGSNFEILLRDKGIATDTGSLVKNLVDHADDQVRAWSADVLGYRHEKSGVAALRQAAEKDRSWLVHESAELALARLGDKSAIGALESLMSSDDHGHQAFLAGQLAEFGDPSGYEFVRQAARSDASYKRSYSAQYFSDFMPLRGDRRLSNDPFKELIALSADRAAEVRESALVCLARAFSQGVSSAEVIAALAEVAERDTDPKLRQTARDQIRSVEFMRDEAARKRNAPPPR
jgi:HEAT repeat protein